MPPSAGERAASPRLRPSASPHCPPCLCQPTNSPSIRRPARHAFHASVCRRTRRPSMPLLHRRGRRPSQASSDSKPATLLCISSADKHAHLPGSVRRRKRHPCRAPYSDAVSPRTSMPSSAGDREPHLQGSRFSVIACCSMGSRS
jgi:hypothetical protein